MKKQNCILTITSRREGEFYVNEKEMHLSNAWTLISTMWSTWKHPGKVFIKLNKDEIYDDETCRYMDILNDLNDNIVHLDYGVGFKSFDVEYI